MSLGDARVRADFNPSKNEDVKWIKENTSSLIDFCAGQQNNSKDPETKRCWSLAMTEFESAAMWAVKAATAASK